MNNAAYWQLQQQGVEALEGARLAEAEDLLARALKEAQRLGAEDLADRAFCNWAAVRIERGLHHGLRDSLSRILGGSPDPKARQLAAYNLGALYRAEKKGRLGRFYADASLRLAREQGNLFSQAVSRHLLGLLWMMDQRPAQALVSFQEAADTRSGGEPPAQGAITLSALGYCLSLTGRKAEGRRTLEESLKLADGLPLLYQPSLRLTAGFACLETGEVDGALFHGRTALDLERPPELAEEGKYAHYLVGEALAIQGANREAREHFDILQKRYYPEIPDLTEMLLSCRTHIFLNWLA